MIGMDKNLIEIGVSAGLVLAIIVFMLAVQMMAPAEFRSAGFAVVILAFIVLMGLAGIKLVDM